jgi:hypothetical protein
MFALWSVVLLSAAMLLFAWAYGAHRRPAPPVWTRSGTLVMLICVAITCGFGFGTGYLAAFLLNLTSQLGQIGLVEAAVMIGALALAVLGTPLLMARGGSGPAPVTRAAGPAARPGPAGTPQRPLRKAA